MVGGWMQIGNRVRALRQKREMTQQELADKIGASRPSVVLWELGDRRIPVDKLRKLAKALHAPVSELFGEKRNSMEPVTDTREVELLRLYRLMPPRMREAYLRLFEETAIRESGDPTLEPAQRHRIGYGEPARLAG